MSEQAAKKGDRVVGVDTHIILVQSPAGPVPTPTPLPFNGPIEDNVSDDVFLDNEAAAFVGTIANNSPAHVAVGGSFQKPPSNKATITRGSDSVFVGNDGMARAKDSAKSCNDPNDSETSRVVVTTGTVFAG